MPDGQFYGAIIWYHLMAPFYGMCVPGITQYGPHCEAWRSSCPCRMVLGLSSVDNHCRTIRWESVSIL